MNGLLASKKREEDMEDSRFCACLIHKFGRIPDRDKSRVQMDVLRVFMEYEDRQYHIYMTISDIHIKLHYHR